MIQPYIYIPDIDLLLRTERALKYGPTESPTDETIEGTLILYMLLNGLIILDACSIFEKIKLPKCSWKAALSKSQKKYVKTIKTIKTTKGPYERNPIKRTATKTKPSGDVQREAASAFDQWRETKHAKLEGKDKRKLYCTGCELAEILNWVILCKEYLCKEYLSYVV